MKRRQIEQCRQHLADIGRFSNRVDDRRVRRDRRIREARRGEHQQYERVPEPTLGHMTAPRVNPGPEPPATRALQIVQWWERVR